MSDGTTVNSDVANIVTGNLNRPVIMMAEKQSDDILAKTPLKPDPQPYYQA